jgi:hypothetical protein
VDDPDVPVPSRAVFAVAMSANAVRVKIGVVFGH